jgi:type VI secretion system secreted protein Hcp
MSAWVSFSAPIGDYCEAQSASLSSYSAPSAGGLRRVAQGSDFSFQKNSDHLSSKLFLACAKGTNFPSVWVELYKTNANIPYLTYKMSDVIVTSFQSSKSGSQGNTIEAIQLNFGALKVEYG